MSESRKLAAILVADVVGYSRLAGADEDRTLARLRGLRSDLIDPAIAAHHGRIVKRTGDGAIIEFRSVVDAVRCAIEVQNGLVERNAGVPEDRRIVWPRWPGRASRTPHWAARARHRRALASAAAMNSSASAISVNSGVGAKPSSAGPSTACASASRPVAR